jgi:protein SCO1/2
MTIRRTIPLLAALIICAAPLVAGDAAPALPPAEGNPLPIPLGGAFSLTDQTGRTRTEADPEGRLQLLFFGYVACESICAVAIPQMAALAERLRGEGIAVRPVLITVDPLRDTPEVMAAKLAEFDPDFVGLTGSQEELTATYRKFGVEAVEVAQEPDGQPIFAHGSFIYLLDGAGKLLTVLPPILSDDRAAEIVAAFAARG